MYRQNSIKALFPEHFETYFKNVIKEYISFIASTIPMPLSSMSSTAKQLTFEGNKR